MKSKALSLLVFASLVTGADCAFAQDEEATSSPFSGNITFVSDYRFRGISQNLNDPALQAGLTYTHSSGVYAGTWISNVDFGDAAGAAAEVDFFAGWGGELTEGLSADVQVLRYHYPSHNIPLAYNELIAKLSYGGLTGSIGYSNDVFASSETGIYYNLAYGLTIADTYDLTASVGNYDLDDVPGYGGSITDYAIGVSRTFGDSLTVGLSYIDTNGALESIYGETNDSQFVFSMGIGF